MTKFVTGLVLVFLALFSFGASAATFQNGSFEIGVAPPPCLVNLPNGSTAISGWTVIQGDIDLYGPSCGLTPTDGSIALDLIGGPGTLKAGIQQTFDTVPGQFYQVAFDLNGNYGAPPVVKPLTVTVDTVVQSYTFDTTGENGGNTASYWTTKTFIFVATSSSATISFVCDVTGLPGSGNAGAVIDNVRVTETAGSSIPTLSGSAFAAMMTLLAGTGFWALQQRGRAA